VATTSFDGRTTPSPRALHPLEVLAQQEREDARSRLRRILPVDAKVSVYLFQPLGCDGLRDESPGPLFDVGPHPAAAGITEPDTVHTCAASGKTGLFLLNQEHCLSRFPKSDEIDVSAVSNYRQANSAIARSADFRVQQARYRIPVGEASKPGGGDPVPPKGWWIHHLALAPLVNAFDLPVWRRTPVLGTIFTLTKEEQSARDVQVPEYSNLIDYVAAIAPRLRTVRANVLFGEARVTRHLGALLEAGVSDHSVQCVLQMLFAHHWFYPYDPVGYYLLVKACANEAAAKQAYLDHGWLPPRNASAPPTTSAKQLFEALVLDIVLLARQLRHDEQNDSFRTLKDRVHATVQASLKTGLALLCGGPALVDGYSTLVPPPSLQELDWSKDILLPGFGSQTLDSKSRSSMEELSANVNESRDACAPGPDADSREGSVGNPHRTRVSAGAMVHIVGLGTWGAPRYNDSVRQSPPKHVFASTKWIRTYFIDRLAMPPEVAK